MHRNLDGANGVLPSASQLHQCVGVLPSKGKRAPNFVERTPEAHSKGHYLMSKPSPEQLAYCLTQVTRFIPSPAPPKVKLQASKWGLKVGQLLSVNETGEKFTVVETDSNGLTLETPDGKVCRLADQLELAHYKKAKKVRSKGKSKDL